MDKPLMENILHRYGIKLDRNNKASCPFHNEKTASFSIKGYRFNCFGCGEKGDSIDFVMKIERCNFKEALNILNLNDFRETKLQKIERIRKNINDKKYWEAYKQFAKFDKYCTENKPARYEEPTKGWLLCNEIREMWWEKLQKICTSIT